MANWENNVRRVVPYVPGEQPKNLNVIKLNTNENPYPPCEGVTKVIREFDTDILRKYPDPAAADLVDVIAKYKNLPSDQVFVGVGSDDVLAMSFMTFFNSEKPIFFPDITYSFYDVWAEEFRIPYETKPLNDDFEIIAEDYKTPNGGVVIPNPNAPTGIEAYDTIVSIIDANPDVVVIIDEAYIDFGGKSVVDLIDKYENLLVVQTFSKSRSLAGSRIGYAMGSKKLISYLNDVKYSFNSYTMDSLTIQIGKASVLDDEYFKKTVSQIIATREWTKNELRRLGFTFGDSKANFIFAKHDRLDAKQIFEALKADDIYVRYFNKPRINQHLRISIGTMEEMQTLISRLDEYTSE